MSSIAITGGATGTGVFSLLAPSTSTNRTLTLPDSTGTVLNDQSNIEAQVKTATNASGSAPVYAARAWVNFNGTGTVAIRASGNVSSITDNGVGDYTVNFATAMPDTNYSPFASSESNPANTAQFPVVNYKSAGGFAAVAPTTAAFRFAISTNGGVVYDEVYVHASVFR